MTAVLVTVFCSLTSFAKPPVRVNVYGVVYDGSGGNYAWHQVQVTPVQNNIFGLTSPDPAINIVTQIAFYFRIESDSFTSFSLSLKKLSTAIQDNTSITLNNVDIACYSQIGPNSGYYSLQNKTQTTRTVNSDGTTDYTWTFVSSTGVISGKPYLKVIIPFQSFEISTTPFYFEMTDFYVDGEGSIFSVGEQAIINELHSINETINGDVGEVSQFDPSTDVSQSYTDASQAFQNDVDTFSGFINQYNLRTTSERVMFPTLLTLSTAGGDLSIILGVCIAACSAGSLIFALRRLHG